MCCIVSAIFCMPIFIHVYSVTNMNSSILLVLFVIEIVCSFSYFFCFLYSSFYYISYKIYHCIAIFRRRKSRINCFYFYFLLPCFLFNITEKYWFMTSDWIKCGFLLFHKQDLWWYVQTLRYWLILYDFVYGLVLKMWY